MSETTPQGYINYLKYSFSDIVKALILIILIFAGLLMAIMLRDVVLVVDGYSIFIYSSIVAAFLFCIIFLLSKKGFLYVIPRQEDFERGPKQGKLKQKLEV